jgi:hypothetical protein
LRWREIRGAREARLKRLLPLHALSTVQWYARVFPPDPDSDIHSLAAAFIHTIHFPASSFKWTTAEDNLQTYVVPTKPWKTRFRCKNCGVAVAGHNGRRDKRSIWGGQLDRETEGGRIKNWDIVKPSAHIFYETRMLDVNDGLSKWAGYEGDSERLG